MGVNLDNWVEYSGLQKRRLSSLSKKNKKLENLQNWKWEKTSSFQI